MAGNRLATEATNCKGWHAIGASAGLRKNGARPKAALRNNADVSAPISA